MYDNRYSSKEFFYTWEATKDQAGGEQIIVVANRCICQQVQTTWKVF